MWMKNSDGKKDAVLTMAFFGFIVVLVKVILSGLTLTINDTVIHAGTIDAAMVAAILTPTLGAYVSRKYTDQKFKKNSHLEKSMPAELKKAE